MQEDPFDTIVELVREVLNVPICAISLFEQHRQWFKTYQGPPGTMRSISFCTQDADGPTFRSCAETEIKTKDGSVIGKLRAVDTIPRDFSPADIAILKKFSCLIRDNIEMREIASCDALTGILSRRTWYNCVAREVYTMRRNKTPITVFMIDIDRFKQVNDQFGHFVGDTVIKAVAKTSEETLRKSDWLGRYGGEEFVAALPGANLANAFVVAERLRNAVAALHFPSLGNYRCTISIGMAQMRPDETDIESTLKRADHALLRAKKEGRNRINTAALPATSRRKAA